MPRFYIGNGRIEENTITLTDGDVSHIKNVLRMKIGEDITVCDTAGFDYKCRIADFSANSVFLDVVEKTQTTSELPVRITLYQGLPKKDKMELIIQKAVELGVSEIVPVMTKRVIVKLEDAKKEAAKVARWNAIAESAAKQSGRGIIPKVTGVMSYKDAIIQGSKADFKIIPYELSEDMAFTRKLIKDSNEAKTAAVFIGPEGGFEVSEVEEAIDLGINAVTLGKRILRTETAGLAVLSVLMMNWER